MSSSVYKVSGTGGDVLAETMAVPSGQTYQLVSVTLHLNAAGTTSEDFTITLDANAGAAYDTILYSADLSAGSVVDLVWQPDEPLVLWGGDTVKVDWKNTERRTYGVEITARNV